MLHIGFPTTLCGHTHTHTHTHTHRERERERERAIKTPQHSSSKHRSTCKVWGERMGKGVDEIRVLTTEE